MYQNKKSRLIYSDGISKYGYRLHQIMITWLSAGMMMICMMQLYIEHLLYIFLSARIGNFLLTAILFFSFHQVQSEPKMFCQCIFKVIYFLLQPGNQSVSKTIAPF